MSSATEKVSLTWKGLCRDTWIRYLPKEGKTKRGKQQKGYPGKTVLIVSHGDAIRNFLVHTGCTTYDQLPDGSIRNCGYAVVQSDGVDFFIKELSGINKLETKEVETKEVQS